MTQGRLHRSTSDRKIAGVPALSIAEERYARGEITAEELAEIRRNLTEPQ
jgi:uncharacterized membrane protein